MCIRDSFCASWCGPCRKEMRSMLTIYNELKADDLEFISVSLDDSEAKWRKMLGIHQTAAVSIFLPGRAEGISSRCVPQDVYKRQGKWGRTGDRKKF